MKNDKTPLRSRLGRITTSARGVGVAAVVAVAAGAYLVLGFAQLASSAQPAHANTTTTLTWITAPGSDGFWNFDFRNTSVNANDVDWPLRFLFRQNAEIDKVKDALGGCASPIYLPFVCVTSGSQNHLQFNDNGYLQWDEDGGIKQGNTCAAVGSQHMRIYANPANVFPYDRNMNGTWGYYVFASVHKDYEGGSGGFCTQYFSAEGEEGWWIQRMLDNLPWTQQSNSYNWVNADAGHWDLVGGHWHWTQSNGLAGYVFVP